jgi:large subunit ribosomal protein L24
MAAKFKRGDKVIVIAGKDKGKSSQVVKVLPRQKKLLVAGVNMVKKHVRPNQYFPQGGRVEMEKPMDWSNLAHIDPKDQKATRVGFKVLEDGKKVRYAKRSGEVIEDNLENKA